MTRARCASWIAILGCWVSTAAPAFGQPVAASRERYTSAKPVAPGRWPDVVAIATPSGPCTGTLVAKDVVLTSAQCVERGPVSVEVGTIDSGRPGEESIAVLWSRAYPDWMYSYDIGVIMLAAATHLEPRAVATTCAGRARPVHGSPLTVVGFGRAGQTTSPGGRLHEAIVPLTDAACTRELACLGGVAPWGEIASGGHGLDACFRDEGGPAYVTTGSGPALLAVASRSLTLPATPCGGGGVFVRVDRVASWIERVTQRALVRAACRAPTDEESSPPAAGCRAGGPRWLAAALALGPLGARRRSRRRSKSPHGQCLEASPPQPRHRPTPPAGRPSAARVGPPPCARRVNATTPAHGRQDQREASGRRDGWRRDDSHHLEVHQG